MRGDARRSVVERKVGKGWWVDRHSVGVSLCSYRSCHRRAWVCCYESVMSEGLGYILRSLSRR